MIIKIIISLVIIYVLYRFSSGAISAIKKLFKDAGKGKDVKDIVDDTDPSDGSTVDEDAYSTTASIIADGQETAMSGYGTDEFNLFEPLIDLNGAQLQQVYRAFDVRDGKNLFEWYKDELCAGFPDPCAFNSYVYHNENVNGCSSYSDQCNELEYARAIWEKSGIPF